MAFDQATRTRLLHFVTDVRGVLETEFKRQLQNEFGLDPSSGAITPLEHLRHLTDAQCETARLLRDTLAHYCAAEHVKPQAGLERIVREQAFTVLNRLAALRMAETRGLLIESVGNAYQAKGFQLYSRLAGAGLGETGDSYRVYLFSVFDELAQDLPSVFDRHSPQGRLFPREAALLAALSLINDPEIEPLWAEDETIGWIYQYFNSKEERKAMRDASQAPRNSRELAVRNQFFTPRYVVEFLVDNTLGRLWFNATGGQTALSERCHYLLVKSDEQPQITLPPRDPRTLKLLDPACGSMHFGLYAFDLFLEIYREAWAWEQQQGPGSLDVSTHPGADFKPLCQTYRDEAAFLRDVPRLIIEQNIYGVDIDPRAAQIATMALWLRAQRAWHEARILAKDRPAIGRGHVLAAVAPPNELDLRKQLIAGLDPLDAELFERTLHLLGGLPELGVLLQVERELPLLIRQVYGEHGPMFQDSDMERWRKAEERLREALTEFANAANATYRGRLFAQDALQGYRIIDLCQERFDILVMNPPFGDAARSTKAYLEQSLPRSKGNILAHFIERASQVVRSGGHVGAIVSRTCFFLQSFAEFRKTVLAEEFSLDCFADLGQGVLDAMVETAAVTWERGRIDGRESVFFRELNRVNKDDGLLNSIRFARAGRQGKNFFKRTVSHFSIFSDTPYVYWIDDSISKTIAAHPPIEPLACAIRVGLQTGDDFRFLRLWWETNEADIVVPEAGPTINETKSRCIELSKTKKWAWYSKTEAASPFLSSIHLCVNWRGDGKEIKAFHIGRGDSASKYVRSEDFYYLPAFSYMLRSSRLVPYIVPAGVIPTAGRSQVYPKQGEEMWLAALLSSNLATAVARFRGEAFWQPKFQNSMVSAIPYLSPKEGDVFDAARVISGVRAQVAEIFKRDETEILFVLPELSREGEAPRELNRETLVGPTLDGRIAELCGLSPVEFATLQRDHNEALVRAVGTTTVEGDDDEDRNEDGVAGTDGFVKNCNIRFSWAIGVAFGRFDLRLATGEVAPPPEPGPFDPLPAKSPGMLPDGVAPFHAHLGVLVDDHGHPNDIVHLVEDVLAHVDTATTEDVRRWMQREFFPFHLQEYSKSRRKAPIYWPLSTTTGSYTLWIYYPARSSQTIYTAINDFLEPKLKQVSPAIARLSSKGVGRSHAEERELEGLQALQLELTELCDNLLKLAPKYKPNREDGVQICAAPLWPLFRHRTWQKVLKDTWTNLEKGEYDWSHLAMNYWPERVREKCKTDKSLAITHGLEDLYVESEGTPKKARGRKKAGSEE